MSTDFLHPSSIEMSELRFACGIPGFPQARQFSVRPWGGTDSPFVVLECVEIPSLHFVATDPAVFFPWYAPRLNVEVLEALATADPDDIALLVILTLGFKAADATANLLGPVAINARSGAAVQAVLSGSGYLTQTPLFQAAASAG